MLTTSLTVLITTVNVGDVLKISVAKWRRDSLVFEWEYFVFPFVLRNYFLPFRNHRTGHFIFQLSDLEKALKSYRSTIIELEYSYKKYFKVYTYKNLIYHIVDTRYFTRRIKFVKNHNFFLQITTPL